MSINDHSQYDKAQDTMSRRKALADIVKKRPSIHWANLLEKHVEDKRIRGWAASIIWWSYPSKNMPTTGQLLFEMMELFRPSVFGRNNELASAFEKLGLPKPVSEFETAQPQTKRDAKVLGWL